MNIWNHAIINFILGLILRFDPFGIFIFVLGAVLIDIDHPIHMIFVEKISSVKKMWKWHRREFAKMGRHRFVFHQVEILLLLAVFGYFINRHLFIFFLGAIVHWVVDVLVHLKHYHNFKSLEYYSITGFLISKFIN